MTPIWEVSAEERARRLCEALRQRMEDEFPRARGFRRRALAAARAWIVSLPGPCHARWSYTERSWLGRPRTAVAELRP